MRVDSMGRPWSRSPSDIDAYLAKLHAETRQSRINGAPTRREGLSYCAPFRSRPRARVEAFTHRARWIASAGAKRKPKEASPLKEAGAWPAPGEAIAGQSEIRMAAGGS